ncbi:uncharacterized protein G2W53_002429 [Senna tora]|uniref:Uncharacterized protein n=1 Tax=Senna tora TaxID=362788 RepID=A0A834XJW2_9FABA|nr:uncharacterized protein G2W53_002429 [Senna tora]
MQILQWLFKGAQEQERKGTKREEDINDQNAKGKGIILLENHRVYRRTKRNEERKPGCKNLKIIALICREDISKAWFYSTLNLKRLGSFNRKLHFLYSMNMMKREKTSISASSHVRNKVLPVSEASFSKSQSKDEAQVEKRKPILRIKELLRWASASKTEKGRKLNNGRKVMQFPRRGTIKSVKDNDQVDVKSLSTITSSAHSVISMTSSSNIRDTKVTSSSNSTSFASTKGNWITTDSELMHIFMEDGATHQVGKFT